MEINPYESPSMEQTLAQPSITRADFAKLLRRYLEAEIKLEDFALGLQKFQFSPDVVIQHVLSSLELYFDELEDPLEPHSKAGWDYYQRLLLLLAADCEIVKTSHYVWSWTQLLAAFTFYGLLFGLLHYDLNVWRAKWLLVAAGIVAWVIGEQHEHAANTQSNPYALLIYPFASFHDLRRAYENVGFVKQKYPRYMQQNKAISSRYSEWFWFSIAMLLVMLFSPIVLLAQVFPRYEWHEVARVKRHQLQ
jgi:disulfide bond formation protein DsbB